MRLYIYCFVLSLFLLLNSTSVNSQPSGWINKPSGTNSALYSVYFTSSSTGYTAGAGGIIRATTDGGDYWYPLYSGTTYTIYDIRFVNQSTGWITGAGGVIRRTTNAGVNWTAQTSGTLWSIYSCYFRNANTGWVAGYGGIILKTTNSGVNWIAQTSGTFDDINSINFSTDSVGWCTGYNGLVLGTTNGGINWSNYAGLGATMNAIQFVTSLKGWAVGLSGAIFTTTDGGAVWSPQASGTANAFYGTYFLPSPPTSYFGWSVGNTGTIKYTSNAGVNWVTQLSYSSQQLRDVFFINSLTGWTVGLNGVILKSISGGLVSAENISSEIPAGFNLEQNFPNPFNPVTTIAFAIPKASNVKLEVFNSSGKVIDVLLNGNLQPGTYKTNWDASNFSSGVYFYKISAEDFSETRKMLLIK